MQTESAKSKGHTRVQWAVAILVNTIVLTYGLQCGWVSPMTKTLQSPDSPVGRPLTDSEISLIAGIPSLSAMVGILILLYVVDTYGRKYALTLMAACQLLCWIIKICPANFNSLLVSRLFCGFGAGGCFTVVPMYIKEISQDNIRGTLGSIGTLFQNVGILTMYILGSKLDYYVVLYLVVGLPVLSVAMLIKAPESPSFLVKKEKPEEAAETIAFLRGLDVSNKVVQGEIDLIKREDEYFKSIPNISFINIFREKAWRRGFLIMLAIFIIHGLNGAFSIVNFASTLLARSDMEISPELQALGIPVFLIIGTAITISSVDKLGRKVILGVAFAISALAFSAFATSSLLLDFGWTVPGWLPILVMLLIVCCYGAGISPVPFIIASELFNFQIRAKLMACLSILAWFMTFLQLVSFTAITSSFGIHVSFYMFSAINLCGIVVVLVLLPETGGKGLEQIEAELRKEKKITVGSDDS